MSRYRKVSLVLITALLLGLTLTPVFGQQAAETYWPTDGWRTSTPEEQGMDSAALMELLQQVKDNGALSMHSIVVIRHGYVVLDASTYPFQSDQKHELFSVTNSFVSALVGIAIDKGLIKSVDQSIWDFFPKDGVPHMDARKEAIQLKHLLTMTAGLDYAGVGGLTDPLYDLTAKDQPWVSWMLDQRMVTEPGTNLQYTDGQSQLVSAIIQKAAGMTALDFARENLFAPLGISDVNWLADPQGVTRAGQDLFLSPLDMAKLGYLFLRKGEWAGQQVISREWVAESTGAQWVDYPRYGYYWWQHDLPGSYYAHGFGGQVIYVFPEQDVVLVGTGTYRGGTVPPALVIRAVKSDDALPPNPEAFQVLQTKVDALQNPPSVAVSPMPPLAEQISGKMYSLPTNFEQWTAIGLICEEDQATLLLDVDGQRLQIPVGLDGVYRVSQQGLPALPGWARPLDDVPLAAKGGWRSPDRFFVTFRDLMGMQDFELYMNFKDGFKLNAYENYALAVGLSYNLMLNGTPQ